LIDPAQLKQITQKVSLDEASRLADELLAGKVRGRVVVEL